VLELVHGATRTPLVIGLEVHLASLSVPITSVKIDTSSDLATETADDWMVVRKFGVADSIQHTASRSTLSGPSNS
jgi:hypothetical protein